MPLKPGTYVMSPKFIKNPNRKLALTRTVRVEKVERGIGQDGLQQDFVYTVELTTSKQFAFGEPIWKAGDTKVSPRKKWAFVPVVPAQDIGSTGRRS